MMSGVVLAAFLLFMSAPVMAHDEMLHHGDVEAIVDDYLSRNPEIVIQALETGERERLDAIISDYLDRHPQAVIRALEAWERLREESEADAARKTIARLDADIHHDPATPWGGNPDGEIVIVEFFDYLCGYCRLSAPGLFAIRDAVPGVKVIYKEFPILGEDSLRAARMALAARAQGFYEVYHEALMLEGEDFSEVGLMALAHSVGLDTERLLTDMNDPAIDAYLERTHQLASEIGIDGTPAFIINGSLYPGAIRPEDFETILGVP